MPRKVLLSRMFISVPLHVDDRAVRRSGLQSRAGPSPAALPQFARFFAFSVMVSRDGIAMASRHRIGGWHRELLILPLPPAMPPRSMTLAPLQ